MEVLDHIPFELDLHVLFSKLHVDEGSEGARDIHDLIDNVTSIINPKAVYEVSYIQGRNFDTVNIGGVIFTSRVLRVNLDKAGKVFPYVATCGRELDEIDIPLDDFMKRFWLDTIKGMVLSNSVGYLDNYLKEKYALEKMSTMSPGSAAQDIWPIEQQKQLFSIFGNVEDLIGVKLTDTFLMIPNKSVSGIRFPTEVSFESCQICQREVCPERRVPFDKSSLESFHGNRT